ncbi:MAG: hypothetical protein SFW07_00125 [Gammaproteobacteria bacterium]|nr:hypothetical protein [Gammaproteobacteria bacterium]
METKRRLVLALVTMLCLGALVSLWYLNQNKTTSRINPYEQYALSLQTPSPASQTNAFVKGLRKINGIQGWTVLSMEYQDGVGKAVLKSNGGSTTQLLTLSQSKGMTVNFLSTGTTINFTAALQERKLSEMMISSDKTVATLTKRLNALLSKNAVSVDETTTNSVFKKIDMTLSFNDVSPSVIESIGTKLDDLPVNINSISATIKNGSLSGNVKISVIGN